MRKITALFFLIVCITGCTSVKNADDENQYIDLSKKIDALYLKKTASFDGSKRHPYAEWVIGLSGMLSVMNGQNVSELNPVDTELMHKTYADCLERDWGITTPKDLVEQITWCMNCGNSKQFESINMVMAADSIVNYEQFAERGFEITEHQFNMVKYCAKYAKHRSLHAWDYGRAVWLVRTGYYVGLMSESDAWGFLKTIGNKIDGEYDSWEDFGANYCIGRIYWAGLSQTGKTLNIYRKLVSENGAWTAIPWRND